jgi:LmbE family N-acetylglucosaminyl deacetylase
MSVLLAEVPSRALAVYAHPDDADVSCGGTLARWVDAGCEVNLVICTQGDKGSSEAAIDVVDLVARRAEESLEAARLLGIGEVHHLGHLDGEIENNLELREQLVTLIRRFRPDALVCPDPLAVFFGEHYYNHRDHRIVGFAALDAAAPAAASPLYFPAAGAPTVVRDAFLSGTLEPNGYVDVSQTIVRKADAILCHKSQLGETGEWFRSVVHERAEEAGRAVGVRHAESFRRIRIGH